MRKLIFVFACLLAAGATPAFCASEQKAAMPLAVGNRWEYSVIEMGIMSVEMDGESRSAETQAEGTCVDEIVGVKERRSNGDIVYEHRSVTKAESPSDEQAMELTVDTLMLVSEKGISVLARKAAGMEDLFSGKWVEYDPPLVMFGAAMSPGKKWKIGNDRDGGLRMPIFAQVAGYETVTVPAGTFKDCLKVHIVCSRITGTMGSGKDKATIKSGRSVDTVWIAPGIGVVKEDNITQMKMQFAPDESGCAPTMTGTNRQIKELQPGYKTN